MDRRILIIIGVVVVLGVVASLVLYFSVTSDTTPAPQAEDTGGFFSFFGSNNREQDASVTPDEQTQTPTQDTSSGVAARFRQVWNSPVSAATFTINSSGDTVVRFIERGTGHVYEASVETTQVARLTNTTIPRIQEASFTTPDTLLIRYLRDSDDVIETFAATILPPRTTATNSSEELVGELAGQFLPQNILDSTHRGNTLFYLTAQNDGSGVRGIVSSFNGDDAREIFTSPIRDWTSQWVDTNTVALTTKASAGVAGHMFLLNTRNGLLTPLIANVSGLTTKTHDEMVLYAEQEGSVPLLYAYNRQADTAVPLPVSTLTEKCTWGESSTTLFCAAPESFSGTTLPDTWYQGITSFNDDIWRIDTATPEASLVLNPSERMGRSFDTVDLAVDETENYLVFRDRSDNTLWLYDLTDNTQPTTDNSE